MPEWEDWGKPKNNNPPSSLVAPKSKYVNTPYGPVLRTQLGRGPTFSPETASQFAPGQVVGGYVDSVSLLCVPIIPNPIKKDDQGGGGGGGGGGGNTVTTKTADTSIFTGAFFSTLPNYSIDALLSLKSLTGNEILQVAHRQNFYTNSAVLNSNILDIVDSINFYSPTQIIKLQKPDLSYFQNNLGSYRLSLVDSVVTINIPSPGIDQSFKMEVETFAPKYIKNDTIYFRRLI